MGEPRIIADYVDSIGAKLSFDPSLSRRVRREIEDHLWEAVARSASGDERAAAAQAVANFGDPQVLAAELAINRLARNTHAVGAAAILFVGGALIAMKARMAWYETARWQLEDARRALATVIGTVDRCAFWLAAALAVSGWLYLVAKPVAASHAALCRQARRTARLSSASALALAVSVTCDALLTMLRLYGRPLSMQSLVPLGSMLAEMALAGGLAFAIVGLMVRMSRTADLVDA
jgi:hypothetical protein